MDSTERVMLTKEIIDKHKAPASGKAEFLRDAKVAGLLLRVMPARANGVVPKYFDFECRVNGAKYRRVFGRWPGMSLQEARRIAGDYRSKIDHGIDPFKLEAERAAEKAAEQAAADAEMDFGGLVDRYFRDHAIPGQKADSSISADRRNLRNHIPGDWYVRKLSSFKRSDFENLRSHIRGNAETKTVRGREREAGGPIIANRVMALLSKMFNLAVGWGLLIGFNPVAGISKFKEHQRTDIFTDDELTRLDVELAKEPLPWQRYFGLVLNTATRKSECLNARWENVDLKENIVTIPRVKRGENHPLVIALTSGARKIIEDMLAERGTSPWLFPSPGGAKSGHMEDADGCFRRLRDRAGIAGRDKTIHLLRHTVATKLARGGTPLPILQKILNHASAATTGRYYHLDANPGREALEKFAPTFGAAKGAESAALSTPPIRG